MDMEKYHIIYYECGHFSKFLVDAKVGDELKIHIEMKVCPDCERNMK